jgi:hypothetical protein
MTTRFLIIGKGKFLSLLLSTPRYEDVWRVEVQFHAFLTLALDAEE